MNEMRELELKDGYCSTADRTKEMVVPWDRNFSLPEIEESPSRRADDEDVRVTYPMTGTAKELRLDRYLRAGGESPHSVGIEQASDSLGNRREPPVAKPVNASTPTVPTNARRS